ncbi:MAG: ribonuclease J [Bacilli bacterium]|nr:ribonuclease J [Bacilli bacterium]MDD4719026.1 ribonuclease J [Bacilli bacterium]
MNKIKIFSLGGLNENGKNMYIVEVDKDIFIFDAGLKYADDKMLGIDYILPNYDYLKENKDRIVGIFITHGHDEHMGAIPDILVDLPDLKIYGTAFTLEIIKNELLDEGMSTDNLNKIKPHQKINFGKNGVFPISLTHSVPDTVGYVLYTESGTIFYTGNYVFDPTMTGAYKTDIGKLAYVGKQGVLCLLSESLYADKRGFTSPSHRTSAIIRETLNKNDGRILFNTFQNQLYRIQELLVEVNKTERKVVIIGKRLENSIIKAIDMKYIDFDKSKIASIGHVRDNNVVVLVSDEREKPYSNIGRIARGFDKFVKINEEDTVVFAAPIYDGLEKSATKLFDDISKIGANLVLLPTKKYLEHHASSEDLMLMLDLIKPEYYFPVIGEYRHQVANAEIALQVGIPEENILLKLNGDVVTFENGKLIDTNEKVKIDDILIDGKTVGDIGELVLKDRESLGENGVVIVTATLARTTKKVVAGPEILTRGFIFVKENIDLIKEAERISLEVINENIKNNYVDFNKVKNGVRDKLGKHLYKETGCKPMILIVMQEV